MALYCPVRLPSNARAETNCHILIRTLDSLRSSNDATPRRHEFPYPLETVVAPDFLPFHAALHPRSLAAPCTQPCNMSALISSPHPRTIHRYPAQDIPRRHSTKEYCH